ncbi:MAG: tRNA (adenosine(37)-N6)-dimethylallyltransferase MiaA [Ignavibacteria bacterium]|nr:tRNA (adenosine(37)-N6)-dimethylallyltransferase MiaA [Ignavibacteria bacterium]MBT8390608.1 tRNA (adenosine(37)-N6)-dimethylallyltransferase MiaA [Ignavibacteria bacterium]NNJ53750.1 tRNA (adenosine(37)-N6)-dimethylallyltransferase MiaA [Ignavibacteriaceae bacterium]NNL20934.1 tRNA (adenosine(37)-N6)-dimethylallyltransferase MiaA [Ignavibacteriaceae bacterium]
MERSVIVIVGPTCSGKTHLSLKLAEYFKSEIISADSRQFYKYLNIGTAKPTEEEQKKVKHHFVNFLEPNEDYNVSKFEVDAEKIINSILNKNKTPIVAGGSGLYIKALIDGIVDAADRDDDYRIELNRKRKEFGNEYLYKELEKVDPETAKKMLPQNWKRVIRALEVYHLTGKPIWKHHQKQKEKSDFKFYQFGLLWNRDTLYKNINARVDKMIEKGLVAEVEDILQSSYKKNLNALNTVGYKEIIQHLEGDISLVRAVELIKRNTRRYAKRQLTWFRKDKRIEWFELNEPSELHNISRKIISKLN